MKSKHHRSKTWFRNIRTLVFLFVCLQLTAMPLAMGQMGTGQANRNIKRNIATVLFSSLGGAVLGLSTLSFYGNPQEHTNNITTGALLGFLAGVGYVTYSSARPRVQSYEYSLDDIDQRQRRGHGQGQMSLAAQSPVLQMHFDF